MDIVLLREPNIVFDSAKLLEAKCGNETCRTLKNAIIKKFSIEKEVLDSCFDCIIELEDYIYSKLDVPEEDIAYLFSRRVGMKRPFASYLLHDVYRAADPDFKAGCDAIKAITRAEFFVNLSSMLSDEFPEASTGDVTNYAELVAFIDAIPLAPEEKWNLLSFFNNFETHRDRLAEMILKTGNLYIEKYELIKHYFGWFTASVADKFNEDSRRFVVENYGFDLSPSLDALYIRPSVTMCDSAEYVSCYTGEKVNDYIYVGALFEPLKEITDSSTVEDRLCRGLRAIGDQRKFEILKLLAESPRYGQQLAALLDISTATVSHHMAILIDCGFVGIKRESNRIYYCLNQRRLDAFFGELRAAVFEHAAPELKLD